MRTLIIHNPCSGFSSDAIFEFERALLKSGDECLVKLVESHWHTDEVLSSVQPEDFDVVVEMAPYLACSTALEDSRHLFWSSLPEPLIFWQQVLETLLSPTHWHWPAETFRPLNLIWVRLPGPRYREKPM